MACRMNSPSTGLFEPTAERVVPTQVCVDGVIHGRNVALAGHVTAGDDLPGEVQSRGCPFAVVTKMLALHVADRHRTDRRSSRLFLSRGRRVPGGDRARIQRPFIECANRDLPDAQNVVLPVLAGSGSGIAPFAADQHTLGSTGRRPAPADAAPRMPAGRTCNSHRSQGHMIRRNRSPRVNSDRRARRTTAWDPPNIRSSRPRVLPSSATQRVSRVPGCR